jgi:hypothetical protein
MKTVLYWTSLLPTKLSVWETRVGLAVSYGIFLSLFQVFVHQQPRYCDACNTLSVSEYVNTKIMYTYALLFQLHVIEIIFYVSCQNRLAHKQ